jgi:hypothetical protein
MHYLAECIASENLDAGRAWREQVQLAIVYTSAHAALLRQANVHEQAIEKTRSDCRTLSSDQIAVEFSIHQAYLLDLL